MKKDYKEYIKILVIFVFTIIGIIYAYRIYEKFKLKNINNEIFYFKDIKDLSIKQMPSFDMPIVNGNGRYVFKPNMYNKYYLFILFTPWDCTTCLKEIPFWNKIRKEFEGNLEVIAIGAANSINMLRHFLENNNIQITTLFDEDENLMRKVLLNSRYSTPLKILVNKNGLVLDETPTLPSSLQNIYLEYLKKLIL